MKTPVRPYINSFVAFMLLATGSFSCQEKDNVPPEITILYPENGETYDTDTLLCRYQIKDDNPSEAYIKVNNNEQVPIPYGGLQKIPVEDGDYKIILTAKDAFNNSSKKEVNVKINQVESDKIAPEIKIYSPENNKTYTNDTIPFSYEIIEKNFKEGWQSWYDVDGIKKNLSKSGIEELILDEGEHKIIVHAEDKAQNFSRDSVMFSVKLPDDTIPPKINVTSPAKNEYYKTSNIPLEIKIDEERLKEATYQLNGGDKKPISKLTNEVLELENGDYQLIVNAKDKKSNESSDTLDFFVRDLSKYKYVIDLFSQPNDSTLNWYGSGDVDGDNVSSTTNDIQLLEKIINGTHRVNVNSDDVVERRTLDRADVNGDNAVNSEDLELLKQKNSGSIPYLPGEWNKLQTPEERETWIEKMRAVQGEIWEPGAKDCSDFSKEFEINFHGFGNLGFSGTTPGVTENTTIELKDNGRFNLPVYQVGIGPFTIGRPGHAMNGIVTKDSLKVFHDNYFIEPQVSQGGGENDWILDYPGGCEVRIRGAPNKNEYDLPYNLVTFAVKGGEANLYHTYCRGDIYIIKSREEAEKLGLLK
ncbi:MAG: dockerin type I repeat-containing protein [Bacteroidales bacterium]|nr:dockerin type I repeat-containing protein [Bacteroidales bacterium]